MKSDNMMDGPLFDSPEELLEHMMKGDPSCTYRIGARVRKANSEVGDHTPEDTAGTVVGSMGGIDHPLLGVQEMYAVRFDNNPAAVGLIIGKKLKHYSE